MAATPPTENQKSLALELGIQPDACSGVEDLIENIEQELGNNRLRELCRWFMISVFRHRLGAQWAHPDESGLSLEQQYSLADAYLVLADDRASLRAVLRDPRCRYALVDFSRHRDLGSLTLSSGTKAFRRAQVLLSQQDPGSNIAICQPGPERPASDAATGSVNVVDRRARRRAFAGGGGGDGTPARGIDPVVPSGVGAEPAVELNEAEYQALEDELESNSPVPGGSFGYRGNEGIFSLLLGMASGLLLFLLILWVF